MELGHPSDAKFTIFTGESIIMIDSIFQICLNCVSYIWGSNLQFHSFTNVTDKKVCAGIADREIWMDERERGEESEREEREIDREIEREREREREEEEEEEEEEE